MKLKYLNYIALAGLLFIASCKDEEPQDEGTTETTEAPAVKYIPYSIVKEYPHDGSAFTEGLQFVDGYLYESTGRYGQSEIRKTDLETGKVLQSTPLEKKYFGEGLAILNGKIYQLTYQEHTGFIYDLKTLKQTGTFTFTNNEGWGMTTDGTSLIYDDGGNVLYYMDPASFQVTKRLEIFDERGPVNYLNELEYIKGHIYANQWQTDVIYKIDPANGKVVGKVDLTDLRQKIGVPYPTNDESAPEVLNGIAYDSANNRIFITGKNWPKMIEVKFDN